jgi:hypothetical protein
MKTLLTLLLLGMSSALSAGTLTITNNSNNSQLTVSMQLSNLDALEDAIDDLVAEGSITENGSYTANYSAVSTNPDGTFNVTTGEDDFSVSGGSVSTSFASYKTNFAMRSLPPKQ